MRQLQLVGDIIEDLEGADVPMCQLSAAFCYAQIPGGEPWIVDGCLALTVCEFHSDLGSLFKVLVSLFPHSFTLLEPAVHCRGISGVSVPW